MTDFEFDLDAAVRDACIAAKRFDPDKIATKVVRQLPPDVAERLVHRAVRELVRLEVRHTRTDGMSAAGRSRWERHHLIVDGLGSAIYVAGSWVDVADCTAELLDTYAADQRARATGLLKTAEISEQLAARLREAGVVTVGELFAEKALAA